MKTLKVFSTLILLFLNVNFASANVKCKSDLDKGPVIIEVVTNHDTVKAALMAVKSILLQEKFISENGIGENGFTAKRTTGSDSDYYIADVMAEMENEKTKVTITLVKVGTGMKSMKKLGQKLKEKLES
jgi:hypothetical protein